MIPIVSIVVPVKNEAERLPSLISALEALDYPRDRYEIIIADNGSSDATPAIARASSSVVVCEQPAGGSYAARNAAVRISRGEILAFTDGDCVPQSDWLKVGVARLEQGADLVAGAIDMVLATPRIDHRFDKKFFLQQQRWVTEKRAGATANLFVKRSVLEATGGFSERLTSGGDFAFCRAATDAGFSIVFEPGAVVKHPTRGFSAILKKAKRIGGGKVERLLDTSTTARQVVPGGKQLQHLLAGESPLTRVGFLLIYGAVCLVGMYGASRALVRRASSTQPSV
jgi:cellulose synthase/poly-beta-1,6-N-acetylglucosamine synthase-like glycosyltransferase